MNEIVNKFLLAIDKFMPEMHLRQPRLTYSACGPFTKNKEKKQNFKETGPSWYIYQNELDKSKLTAPNKVLRDKAFNTAKNPKYDGYQKGFAAMVYKFFDKKISGTPADNVLVVILKMRIFQTTN